MKDKKNQNRPFPDSRSNDEIDLKDGVAIEPDNAQVSGTNSQELFSIKKALVEKSESIADILRKKFRASKGWVFNGQDVKSGTDGEIIDLVFVHADPDDKKYVVLDLSIPHLGIGQKFTLDKKAKAFQKDRNLTALRIKKAILMVRKGTETISTSSSRLRCPIIELNLKDFISPEEVPETPKTDVQVQENSSSQILNISPELLSALKDTLVHESLSTMYKRRRKYVHKGLWRWIEREILDPNVHFFLIILSSIYQGKSGDVLSKRFKTVTDYSQNVDAVIEALFSNESGLAPEIMKNDQRHKKALHKFLECFTQTPPFEYLRMLFLKEFRTTRDGLKARLSVFSTLNQLLCRCGFQGEKETQYPLEILDELGIFQGLLAGDYTTLRIDNAIKKLTHLVPQKVWNTEEVYKLREDLAKLLGLPAAEFNLNAFLPQAFMLDAQQMAAQKRKTISSSASTEPKAKPPLPIPGTSHPTGSLEKPVNRQCESRTRPHPDSHRQPANVGIRAESTRQVSIDRAPSAPVPERTGSDRPQTSVIPMKSEPVSQPATERQLVEPPQQPTVHPRPQILQPRYGDCDESKHRFFEYFGGHTEEDPETVRLSIEIMKKSSIPETAAPAWDENNDPPPSKKLLNNGGQLNNGNGRNRQNTDMMPPRKKLRHFGRKKQNNKSKNRPRNLLHDNPLHT